MADILDNEQFFEHLLEDFFEEADQHLQNVRRHLLSFEGSLEEKTQIEAAALNELFRSFHTLKGISGMAGVPEAENLAHHLEGILRTLRDRPDGLTDRKLQVLIEGTRRLEKVVAARHSGESPPPIDDVVETLESITSESDEGLEPAASISDLEPTLQHTDVGEHQYLVVFEPSGELAALNINVNSVRDRLTELGQINESRPVVAAGGKIAFEFLVTSAEETGSLREHFPVGVTVQELEPAPPPEKSRPELGDSAPVEYIRGSNVVRVDLPRLDDLMLLVGELVITRAKLSEQIRTVEEFLPVGTSRELHETNQKLEKQLRNLRDGVMRVRMVPIGDAFERMRFLAADIARDAGKRLSVAIEGGQTEIDKLVVERIFDPLLHLVRNSISHGIEAPAVRLGRGKPESGRLRLSAATVGDSILIEVGDDGEGIDRGTVSRRAVELGVLAKETDLELSDLVRVLCAPGFSTRENPDKTSGRGVGMDVVQRAVDELGGRLSIDTAPGNGTRFSIKLPLTLSIADALIIRVGGERYAVPQTNVDEVIEVSTDSVKKFENNEVIQYGGRPLPIVRLAGVFNRPDPERATFHALVVGDGVDQVAIAVEKVTGQNEIVVRPIRDPLAQVQTISGATELGDGRPILIINVAEVANSRKRNR